MSRTKKSKPGYRSRAAKREAEQALLEGGKLLQEVPRPEEKPAVLNTHKNAGVFKKTKEKKMTRAQRRRQQKGIARAAEILDKTENKTEKSQSKASTLQERRAAWEQVNVIKKNVGQQVSGEGTAPIAGDGDEDETMKTTSPAAGANLSASEPAQSADPATQQLSVAEKAEDMDLIE
ncbi:hypothetical protein KEM54_001074 [Ascosphaera aggregata]|nr:hypothetical protein KEM54_001074 [Ascosphaera aggregata]